MVEWAVEAMKEKLRVDGGHRRRRESRIDRNGVLWGGGAWCERDIQCVRHEGPCRGGRGSVWSLVLR